MDRIWRGFDNHLMGFEVIWSILYQTWVDIIIASAKAMCNTSAGLFWQSLERDTFIFGRSLREKQIVMLLVLTSCETPSILFETCNFDRDYSTSTEAVCIKKFLPATKRSFDRDKGTSTESAENCCLPLQFVSACESGCGHIWKFSLGDFKWAVMILRKLGIFISCFH